MNNQDRRTFIKTTTCGMTAVALSPLLEPVFAMPFSRELSVAVIGAGRQGRNIVGELSKLENVKLAAICDVDPSRLKSGLRRARGAEGFATHKELLDKKPDVQAVIVATPTHLHKDVAIDVMETGKHVYCESPLASTVEDCHALVKAARNANVIFQTGMQGRSNPIYKLAYAFVVSGSISDPGGLNMVSMRGQYHRKTSWRSASSDPAREKALNWRLDPAISTGLAGEFGTQQFDVFNWYAREYPTSVRGGGAVLLYDDGREVFDTVQCSFTYDKGVQLNYEASLANSYEHKHELFFGTMGTVKLTWTHGWLFKEADAPTQGWEVYANRQQFHNEEGITLIADATQLASQGKLKEGIGLPNDSLFYSLEDFLRSVDEGKPPACSVDEGMRAAIVGIMANKAIVTGEQVKIDEALFKV